MTKTIFIVEDDHSIRDMLRILLEHQKYQVISAQDYRQAVTLSQTESFHLVLLDWMLPGGNGIQFIKHLKNNQTTKDIPIIMLTAKQDENDQLMGLDTGADDYITKPFSNKELIARIKAILRRSYPNEELPLIFGELKIDLLAQRVFLADVELSLGPTEYKLLSFLAKKPERVFSREQLITAVWGNDAYIDDRTVDVHIGRLRKQLEPSGAERFIQTVRGSGYRFSA